MLKCGGWLQLPRLSQKLLTIYTLTAPFVQALQLLYVPFGIWAMLCLRVPVLVSMLTILPLYILVFELVVDLIGIYEFADEHDSRPSFGLLIKSLIACVPYSWILGYAAINALVREFRGINCWDKTDHPGAHRNGAASSRARGLGTPTKGMNL